MDMSFLRITGKRKRLPSDRTILVRTCKGIDKRCKITKVEGMRFCGKSMYKATLPDEPSARSFEKILRKESGFSPITREGRELIIGRC